VNITKGDINMSVIKIDFKNKHINTNVDTKALADKHAKIKDTINKINKIMDELKMISKNNDANN
jgi:hypothetical protein